MYFSAYFPTNLIYFFLSRQKIETILSALCRRLKQTSLPQLISAPQAGSITRFIIMYFPHLPVTLTTKFALTNVRAAVMSAPASILLSCTLIGIILCRSIFISALNNPPKSGTKRPMAERKAPKTERHPGNRNTTDSGVLFCLFANCFPRAGRLSLETVSHGPCADCKNSNFPNGLPAVLIPATSCFPAANGRQITDKLSAKFFRRLLCTRARGTA